MQKNLGAQVIQNVVNFRTIQTVFAMHIHLTMFNSVLVLSTFAMHHTDTLQTTMQSTNQPSYISPTSHIVHGARYAGCLLLIIKSRHSLLDIF